MNSNCLTVPLKMRSAGNNHASEKGFQPFQENMGTDCSFKNTAVHVKYFIFFHEDERIPTIK